jgi:hypothetical protein
MTSHHATRAKGAGSKGMVGMTSMISLDSEMDHATITRYDCKVCGQPFQAAHEATPDPRFCSPKCAGAASSHRRKGQSAGRRKQGDDQATVETSGPTLAETVDQLIRDGFLPAPTIRLAYDNSPVWSFGLIASLFDLPTGKLIEELKKAGPVHRMDDVTIPSTWALLKDMAL